VTTAQLTEAQLQKRITDLAAWLGLYTFHSTDPRRDTAAGWPDLTILNLETGAMLFAELKRQNGRVSTKQTEVLTALARGGHEARIWRPDDWPEIEAALRELAVGSA
jgi:hypothetical protein